MVEVRLPLKNIQNKTDIQGILIVFYLLCGTDYNIRFEYLFEDLNMFEHVFVFR